MTLSPMSMKGPFVLLGALSLLLFFSLWSVYSQPASQRIAQVEPEVYDDLAYEFEEATKRLLRTWYPRAVDEEYGGYLTDFDADWELAGAQRKMIVTQARHLWTASQAAMRYPDEPMFLEIARHGFEYLKDTMWDFEHGGFFTLVSREGQPVLDGSLAFKTAYGNAFAIYGIAAYAKASQDTQALTVAKEAFMWLDTYSYDPEQGGYFQHLNQDGSLGKSSQEPPKDQNSSIHLLEAFTALYEVWPDETVRSRLEEMLLLVRDTMVQDEQYLQLYFEADWTPVSFRDSLPAVREANYWIDHVSVGHDVETAFLMLEAAHALGIDDTRTRKVGKSMVDHALKVGWDQQTGGFYDGVYYLPGDSVSTVVKDTKTWWAQAEGLNSLLLMHSLYPDHVPSYFNRFEELWAYSKTYLIDLDRGGWYSGGMDKEPELYDAPKAHMWKGNYHTLRSLMQCADRLHERAEL